MLGDCSPGLRHSVFTLGPLVDLGDVAFFQVRSSQDVEVFFFHRTFLLLWLDLRRGRLQKRVAVDTIRHDTARARGVLKTRFKLRLYLFVN